MDSILNILGVLDRVGKKVRGRHFGHGWRGLALIPVDDQVRNIGNGDLEIVVRLNVCINRYDLDVEEVCNLLRSEAGEQFH